VIKSGIIRWAEHVVDTGILGNAYRILVGKLERKRLLKGLGHG
jgi:hypothetical protein